MRRPATIIDDLQNVTNGVGALSGVASMRDTYRADLVTLMTATPGSPFCGVAWLMTSVSAGFQSLGFNVVEQTCAVGNLTFAHELGHNMGLRHDWYMDNGTTPVFLRPRSRQCRDDTINAMADDHGV